MSPYRDGVVHRSDVIEIRWERADPDAPRVLVIEHDPGEAGLPEQRRLPEGYGLEALGGVFGFLSLGALLAHRLGRSVAPIRTHVRLDPGTLIARRSGNETSWSTASLLGFGVGEDSPEWRTVFLDRAEGRELLLEGLPPEDARRAVEALDEALRSF
ncbi:MAG: hypothetical protein H6719_28680 [Sandaracinaceae bacterium]|nr:hypothetical protein [Sandaracinaceae bacterium]